MAIQQGDKGRRVTIDLTPAAAREVDRLKQITGLSTADIFRHAITIFRIYVDAKKRGAEMLIIDPGEEQTKTRLELPISV